MGGKIDVETYEKEVTRTYVKLDGEEFTAARVLDLLDAMRGTDGFIKRVSCTGIEDNIAEILHDADLLGRSIRGSYYADDDESVELLYEQVRSALEGDD